MHKITFFPLGNADTCLIDLANGSKMLFDYANMRSGDDDKKADLPTLLREDLKNAKRDHYDVFAITHADNDHVQGASEFFYLDHAQKYQGEGRVKIEELWVPAALIVESNTELPEDGKILKAEAKHRLENNYGIRVFSRPDRLKTWLESKGIAIEDRRHLISDAGQLVPGFSKNDDGVEFFIHSPFAVHVGDKIEDRNECSLMFQVVFASGELDTKFFLCGDTKYERLLEIVNSTIAHKRPERLEWDILDIPHHCSYNALSSEKGKDITEPLPEIKLFMDSCSKNCKLIGCCDPIPSEDTDQPPHRQAAAYYALLASENNGELHITMSYPPKSDLPQPIVIIIDDQGATLKKQIVAGGASLIRRQSDRAGD